QGDGAPPRLRGQGGRHLEAVEGRPGVAVGAGGEVLGGGVVDGERRVAAEAPDGVGQGPVDQPPQVVLRQGLEPEQRGTAPQRTVDLEEGVLGGGADQREEAVLDVGQEGVLLGAVEAVDLVEEQDRALALLTEAGPGPLHDLPHLLHAGGDGRHRLEGLGRGPGHQPGDGGLAGAGRAPEDARRQPVGLDQRPQRLARRQQVLLAGHLVEGAGPHPARQRRPGRHPPVGRLTEQIVAAGHPATVARRRRVKIEDVTRRRLALVIAGLALGSACATGSSGPKAIGESTTTTTAAATTSSTAAPAGCPKLRPASEPAPPQNLADLQMVNPTKGFAAGRGVILGTDDGHTWTPRYTGGAAFVQVDAVDAVHAWAVGDRALYATVDGGRHWVGDGSPDDGTVLRQVHFIDEHFGWGVGRNGKLYRSGDAGHTWGDLEPPCGAEQVCFTAQEDGWVAAGNRI